MYADLNATPPVMTTRHSIVMDADLDRVFRHLSMEGDRWTGEVEAPMGHVTAMSLTVADLITAREADEYHHDAAHIGKVAPGHYIVLVNNSGIVWALAFDTAETRDEAFNEYDKAYAEWLGPEITDLDG